MTKKAARMSSDPCRAGEESAFVVKNRRSRFLAPLGMTGGGAFRVIGGPKAHVTLPISDAGDFHSYWCAQGRLTLITTGTLLIGLFV
jgi:hypothetical protein